jgi:hypothetical protein
MFTSLTAEDISSPSSIKNYEKYASSCNDFKTSKGMPKHVKAAYFYNLLLDKLQLGRKYEKISSGDNMKYFPVRKPNKYGLSAIGYKYDYPKEFAEIFEPDYESVFEKDVYSVIQRFYECVKWQLKTPSQQVQTDLFELLGI